MQTLQRLFVVLAFAPTSGIMGPRILCVEGDGAATIELASVRCCGCCPERDDPSCPTEARSQPASTCDDIECARCTDAPVEDHVVLNHTSPKLDLEWSCLGSHYAFVLASVSAPNISPLADDADPPGGAFSPCLDGIVLRI